jgi:hypothetical protein
MDKYEALLRDLNDNDARIRLDSLKGLMKMVEAGELKRPEKGRDINNHIHTFYSFSPYSPSKAIWMAFSAGLSTA